MSRNAKSAHAPAARREPKIMAEAVGARTPKLAQTPNLDLPIAWNFNRMDQGGKFKCNLQLLGAYTAELVRLEGKTINELMGKKHNHPMGAAKLSAEARARLEVLNIEEGTLFQLDLKTPARLWGVFEHNIFHIIWLDPAHEVYPTPH